MGASAEEFRALQATARIRHAYLEIAPIVAPYLSTATTDDPDSVLETYGTDLGSRSSMLLNLGHGLTTMPGMIAVLDAALAGGLVGSVVVALGGDARLALVARDRAPASRRCSRPWRTGSGRSPTSTGSARSASRARPPSANPPR